MPGEPSKSTRANRTVLSALVCSVALFVGPGSASPQTPAEPAKPAVTLKPVDDDGDGKVTRAEWSRFVQSFSKYDVDKDAAVDVAELRQAAATTDVPLILEPADMNGDGKVNRAEWSRMAQSFKQIDANRDGTFDLAELQAALDAKAEAAKLVGVAPITGLWRGWLVDGRGENPNGGTMQIELAITADRIAGREVGPKGDSPPDLGVGSYSQTGNVRGGYLDALYIGGPHAGQLCLGIFRLENDVLYWCASNRTGTRPNEFITGSGFWYMILRRVPTTGGK